MARGVLVLFTVRLTWLAFLPLLSTPISIAHAQDLTSYYASPAPPPIYTVDLACTRADVELTIRDDHAVVATCLGACRLVLPAGRYRIWVRASRETAAGEQTLVVTRSQFVRITPKPKGKRTIGLVTAISGMSLSGLGLLTLFAVGLSGGCYGEDACGEPETPEERRQVEQSNRDRRIETYVAIGMLGVGTALTAIGWWQVGDSRRPAAEVRHTRHRTSRSGFSARLVPVDKGAVLSGRFAF